MANSRESKRLDAQLERAASQWREEDLSEIMALLDKDYSKPQEPKAQEPEQQETGVEPEEVGWEPASPQETMPPLIAGEPEDALDGLQELLDKDYTKEDAQPGEAQPEDQPREEYIPTEPHRVGTGEQPSFDDAPAKKEKDRVLILLGLLAALEVLALVCIAIWWHYWMR